MHKSVRRRRKGGNTLRRTRRRLARVRPLHRHEPQAGRGLLRRILDTPQLAQAIGNLQPELLHRIIGTCGLEDCGDLIALATPAQLQRVFDLDLWRPPTPGTDEQLDADRFAVWLEVLMDLGPAAAAQKLIGFDADLVIAALAQHVLVFDRAALSSPALDGEHAPDFREGGRLYCEIGTYLVAAKRGDGWGTIVDLLMFLDAEHPHYFHALMAGCRSLSNSDREIDGLDELLSENEQDMFDLALDREERREKQGYVTPAQARAFLHSARQLQLDLGTAPPLSPLAAAYFRDLEWAAETPLQPVPNQAADGMAAVVEILVDAGVLPKQPLALLESAHGVTQRLARIHAQMQFLCDADRHIYSLRTAELGYLANAIAAGCAVQGRPFTPREAMDAAAAVCNLGLENWPAAWLPIDEAFLVQQNLIGVFQVGWTVLHRDVCMHAAERLIHVVAGLSTSDTEIRCGLDALRVEMTRHWQSGAPWLAREALEVILFLDQPAWAALLGLIDECPVLHAAISLPRGAPAVAIDAASFEFVSENHQIAAIREFLWKLPATLSS